MRKILKNKNAGFSLIEIAIAVVVIGLVIGVTLKGKELIHTARVNSIIEQVNSFKIATQMFVDKYGAIPGDLTNAADTFGDSVKNGTGSGRISTKDDAERFWSHLIASDFLTVELVNGFPTSKLGGYYTVSSDIKDMDGVWVILNTSGDNRNFSGIITQEEAYMIDKKNDTGNPATGEIRVFKGNQAINKYDLKNKDKDCIILFRIW